MQKPSFKSLVANALAVLCVAAAGAAQADTVAVTIERNSIEHDGKHLALTPGMSTDASILTGQRTVLGYVIKPIVKTFESALQER